VAENVLSDLPTFFINARREVTRDVLAVENLQRVFICVQFTIIMYMNAFVKGKAAFSMKYLAAKNVKVNFAIC